MTEISDSRRQLEQQALDHVIFTLIPTADLEAGGANIFVRGEGVHLEDHTGRRYLDMISAVTRANSLGYGNREIADAVQRQLSTLHYAGTASNIAPPTIELATRIAELTPNDLTKLYFANDGSEAVESALKIAKHYQITTNKPRAFKIISRWNAYHGATMGAIGATDWLGTRHISEPGVPGYSQIPGPMCYRNPFNMDTAAYGEFCAEYLEKEILHQGPDLVAAFIAEPVMQANGVQIPPDGYFDRVREICDRYGVLLIIDEVICGFGRTGDWFASNRLGIKPDLLTMAKAMTAGYLPMGAVAVRPEIIDALPVFRHVHTFSGHPACAAAANTVITIKMREGLIEQGRINGAYFLESLQDSVGSHPIVGEVRGIGMWLAIDFTADKRTRAPLGEGHVRAIVQRMRQHGVIVSAIGTALEIAPSLISTRDDLDEACRVATLSINEIASERGLA